MLENAECKVPEISLVRLKKASRIEFCVGKLEVPRVEKHSGRIP